MKIDVNENGDIVLKEVYSGILLETSEGNRIGICMRDDTFEINVMPAGTEDSDWFIVNMTNLSIEQPPEPEHVGRDTEPTTVNQEA